MRATRNAIRNHMFFCTFSLFGSEDSDYYIAFAIAASPDMYPAKCFYYAGEDSGFVERGEVGTSERWCRKSDDVLEKIVGSPVSRNS